MMHSQAQHTAHDLCAVGPSSCRGDKRGDATRSGTGTMSTSMPSKSSTAEERGKSESLKPFSKNTRALWRRRGKPSLMNLTLPVPRRMKLVAASHVLFVPQKKLCFRSGQPRSSPIRPPAERFREVCLIDSLRAHRYKVQYTADGPFWAMADGNKFLRPWQNLCRFHIFVFFKFFTLFDQ